MYGREVIRMGINKVGIIWNPGKKAGIEIACELIKILDEYKIAYSTGIMLAHALGRPECCESGFEDCDLLMVLGGDGTILSALDHALPHDIPMLGINLGRLGFLTEVDPCDLRKDVTDVLEGRYTTDQRIMMTIRGQDQDSIFALNEIVVTRSTPALRVLSLEIDVNGIPVDRISGDGLIVASATGSTGYSLSAGGPIMRPGLGCFVITPICSHTMNARPVVVSADDTITIRVLNNGGGTQAVMDGRKVIEIGEGEPGITILRHSRAARFVRLHDRNYFSLLRDKLSEWTH